MITGLHSEPFGLILYVEVGSIRQNYQPEPFVKKRDEKDCFEFGGSCIALLFGRGKIRFDEDLLKNTKAGFKARVNFGESLGSSL